MPINYQFIYEQAQTHGAKVQSAGQQHGQHRYRRRLQLGLTPRPTGRHTCIVTWRCPAAQKFWE